MKSLRSFLFLLERKNYGCKTKLITTANGDFSMLALTMPGAKSMFRGDGYLRDIFGVDAAAFKDLRTSIEKSDMTEEQEALLADCSNELVMQKLVGISFQNYFSCCYIK
jgi:hypothetical protein